MKEYIKQHRDNRKLIVVVESALLENKKLFEDVDYIRDELKLVKIVSKVIKQVDKDKENDINALSKFIIYSLDSIVHRQVLHGNIVDNDEDLVEYLVSFILKFIT